jgi:hypothetical protein
MLRPVCSLPARRLRPPDRLSTPRSGMTVSLHAWGLLLGAPMLTEMGLAPTGKAQRAMNFPTPESEASPFITSRRTMVEILPGIRI